MSRRVTRVYRLVGQVKQEHGIFLIFKYYIYVQNIMAIRFRSKFFASIIDVKTVYYIHVIYKRSELNINN